MVSNFFIDWKGEELMSVINIGIELPKDAITQKIALLGRTGSGKTYGATKLAEEFHKIDAQFVVVDPVGVWWGLRLSADGRDNGISIPVFGGLHGDIPLEPSAGKLLADVITERGISAILDISQFEHNADKARFAEDFAARFFFRKKAMPSAVHLFLEEAQEFIPQNPAKGEERMLGAFERLWKLGRNFGIGGSLISQRPQEVNKKALNQTECIFAFQMTGVHERKAVENWIADKGIDEDISAILPKLEVGEARIWSPQWLKLSKTFHISKKKTYDASSTPEVGKHVKFTKPLAPLELEKLKDEMKQLVEKADSENPVLLRKRIRDLEFKLRGKVISPKPQADPAAIARAEDAAYRRGVRDGSSKYEALNRDLERKIRLLESGFRKIPPIVSSLAEILDMKVRSDKSVMISVTGEVGHGMSSAAMEADKWLPKKKIMRHELESEPVVIVDGESEKPLRSGAMRMLSMVAMFHPKLITKEQIAVLSGFTARGGTFNTYLRELKAKGWVREIGDAYEITEEGLSSVGEVPESPPDNSALLDMWASKFRAGAGKLLRIIAEAYPDAISRDELSEKSGMSYSGGTFWTYLRELRRAGLISNEVSGEGFPDLFRATDELFISKR